jgi:hypothetical protein
MIDTETASVPPFHELTLMYNFIGSLLPVRYLFLNLKGKPSDTHYRKLKLMALLKSLGDHFKFVCSKRDGR